MNFSLALFAENSNKNQESCFGNLDDEDRTLFDEAFIHKSIGEQDDLEEDLYHEQMLHSAGQEVWDDLLEENVLDDLDESNFPGAVGLHKDCFQKFVVCPKCHSLYNYDSAYETVGGKRLSKKCSYVEFPNHRHRAHRKPCNEVLLKEVKLQDGKLKLYPKKVYCYNSVIETLKLFLQRPGFSSQCELWRERESTSIRNLLSDVIHGTVWRDFKGPDGSRFMSHQRNLALMMNVDWFQPFKHSPYSVGVIYLALMNLPRGHRYKRENIIVVGIIPGPSEPSSLNPYLVPLVSELKELWEDGIELCHSGSPRTPERFFAAVLLVACDVPAARKLCGFLGHGARRGCSKCKKEFIPGENFGMKMNFGGFDSCMPRTNVEHRNEAQEILAEDTYQGREHKESKYGTRYSELMQLE